MHANEIVLAAESTSTFEEHLAALRNERPRVFWLGLTLALFAHAVLIVGIGSAKQRTLGTPDGAADAIAVEIVDGATLKDSMAPPTPPAPAPGGQQPSPAQQPAQPQQTQPEVPPPPPPPEVAAPQPPAEAAPPPAEKTPDTKAVQSLPEDFADALSELESMTADQEKPQKAPEEAKPAPKQPEAKAAEKQPPPKPQQQAKQQPAKKRTQTSALDLSVPTDEGGGSDDGGSSAVQRPPGITRSGENDEFARNVIRALQKTMPRERANGRVTVRIVLSENGSRADVKLLQSGGNPDLDFNVMFAARQTAYPFPPHNSTLVDRTFTVTYIYR
jgi:TonB family protein